MDFQLWGEDNLDQGRQIHSNLQFWTSKSDVCLQKARNYKKKREKNLKLSKKKKLKVSKKKKKNFNL